MTLIAPSATSLSLSRCCQSEKHLLYGPDRIAVYLDSVINVRRIPSAHSRDDRYVTTAGVLKYHLIPPSQSVDRQTKPAQVISHIRVGTGEIKNNVRVMERKTRQGFAKRRQIFLVRSIVREF